MSQLFRMLEDMKLHISAFQDSAVLLTFVVAKEDTQIRNIFKNYPENKPKQNPPVLRDKA